MPSPSHRELSRGSGRPSHCGPAMPSVAASNTSSATTMTSATAVDAQHGEKLGRRLPPLVPARASSSSLSLTPSPQSPPSQPQQQHSQLSSRRPSRERGARHPNRSRDAPERSHGDVSATRRRQHAAPSPSPPATTGAVERHRCRSDTRRPLRPLCAPIATTIPYGSTVAVGSPTQTPVMFSASSFAGGGSLSLTESRSAHGATQPLSLRHSSPGSRRQRASSPPAAQSLQPRRPTTQRSRRLRMPSRRISIDSNATVMDVTSAAVTASEDTKSPSVSVMTTILCPPTPPPPPTLEDSEGGAALAPIFAALQRDLAAVSTPPDDVNAWMLQWFEDYQQRIQEVEHAVTSLPLSVSTESSSISVGGSAMTSEGLRSGRPPPHPRRSTTASQLSLPPPAPPPHSTVPSVFSSTLSTPTSAGISLAARTSSLTAFLSRPVERYSSANSRLSANGSGAGSPLFTLAGTAMTNGHAASTATMGTGAANAGVVTASNDGVASGSETASTLTDGTGNFGTWGASGFLPQTGPANPFGLSNDLRESQREHEAVVAELFARMEAVLDRLGDSKNSSSCSSGQSGGASVGGTPSSAAAGGAGSSADVAAGSGDTDGSGMGGLGLGGATAAATGAVANESHSLAASLSSNSLAAAADAAAFSAAGAVRAVGGSRRTSSAAAAAASAWTAAVTGADSMSAGSALTVQPIWSGESSSCALQTNVLPASPMFAHKRPSGLSSAVSGIRRGGGNGQSRVASGRGTDSEQGDSTRGQALGSPGLPSPALCSRRASSPVVTRGG